MAGWLVVALLGALVTPTVADAPTLELAAPGAAAMVPADRIEPPGTRVTWGFTGDIHMLRSVNQAAYRGGGVYDYSPMFARVAPLLGWFDIASCHMEAPVAPVGSAVIVEPPLLSTASSLIPALAGAGYDRCSAASNHMLDRGTAGVDATLGAMDVAGLGHTGAARSASEATAVTFTAEGITFAHLSYTFYAGTRPRDELWRVNKTDASAIISMARSARANGAQVVVLSLEWGTDKQAAVTAQQRSLANTLTASGEIDLIVGHQAHVLQPIEQVNGVWVIYGMGNFLSSLSGGSWPPGTRDAAIFGVDFTVTDDGRVTVSRPVVYPTWIDRSNGMVVRLTIEANDPSLSSATQASLRASLARTRAVLGDFFAPGV